VSDARHFWPDFPSSPLQMDPVIHMMFKAMANRLKEVNDKINNISDAVVRDLACRLFFDGLLHPIPSSTVLKFVCGQTQTIIDNFLEAYWINTATRQSATYYFSPLEPKAIQPVEAVVALAKTSDTAEVLWCNPQWRGKNHLLTNMNFSSIRHSIDDKDTIYIGLKRNGAETQIPALDLFISGSPELLGLLRWGSWNFTESESRFGNPRYPGDEAVKEIEKEKTKPQMSIWGHNYFPHEHLDEYRNYFFALPVGNTGKIPDDIKTAFTGQEEGFWNDVEPLYWIKIESDRRIAKSVLKSFELAATNCLVAINAHGQKQSYFYNGPGAMTLELQSSAGEVYEIISIDDNHGRVYSNVYALDREGDKDCRYIPRIKGKSLEVVINPPARGAPPDRFYVHYRTSSGFAGNGILAGLINALYNPQPGIESVVNLTLSKGGVNAKSFDDMVDIFLQVLRSHNRAIVSADYESMALAFDQRIKSASPKLGSSIRNGILYRCIEIELDMGGFIFEPAEEGRLFLARIQRYLESRSPMGTAVVAKLAK
jgi:hypothetical protein